MIDRFATKYLKNKNTSRNITNILVNLQVFVSVCSEIYFDTDFCIEIEFYL